ncbi:uncharacterized protein MKK02DRAFT_35664 [Dioszegia hungarica]|uniref:NAD(P)-binding protein n=1 Tax=Dioszegia hungarica TaxID=4972 RepID=A0AA38H136_9TREE|nr:uncharacterized protein MKK02DRAFT_35664 [Dioszegia hungarica]KAI9631945.1 hypothetical protein MKK02DRAFT_35664 [Dioszegia hungarica]
MPRPAAILNKGAVALVTGAASGIGLAASKAFAARGLHIVAVDVSSKLDAAVKEIKGVDGVGQVEGIKCDVSKISEVEELREKVLDLFGEVDVLLNNAGIGPKSSAFSLTTSLADLQATWHQTLDTNFFGILNVAQAFAPHMARQENASCIINTGSKQGITCPPGNAGYNVSKAAVKAFTEQLAHELRNVSDVCSAHLFVPGWVHTGLTGAGSGNAKPHGAWTPEQTVDYMMEKVFEEGDFYVICPDNDTTVSLDKARIQWNTSDIIENRPALSRWHPAYKARYEDFIQSKQGLSARSRSRGRTPLQMETHHSPGPSRIDE